MGTVYAKITLKNAVDVVVAQRGDGGVKEQKIRKTTVTAMVDTGAISLVINEKVCQRLGLGVHGERRVRLANETKEKVKIADPVEVHWKNRSMVCAPLVMPGTDTVLLGAIPLEDMDLMVDPVQRELVGVHGDEIISLAVGVR